MGAWYFCVPLHTSVSAYVPFQSLHSSLGSSAMQSGGDHIPVFSVSCWLLLLAINLSPKHVCIFIGDSSKCVKSLFSLFALSFFWKCFSPHLRLTSQSSLRLDPWMFICKYMFIFVDMQPKLRMTVLLLGGPTWLLFWILNCHSQFSHYNPKPFQINVSRTQAYSFDYH
jgi:hypothetical protein